MAAFLPLSTDVISNTSDGLWSITYSPYSTAVYDNWPPAPRAPASRRARELEAKRARLADQIRRFGESVLVQRVAREERERKVMLDARSRARGAPAPTKRQDARRLQTYQAALDMRMLRR